MIIYLDGLQYDLAPDTRVRRASIQEWPDNIRLDGQQQRKDRRGISSFVIDSWAEGLGRKEINVATAADLSSLWDAENVDTRFDGQIVLSPAFNTCTIVPSRGDLDLNLQFLDNLYFVESQFTDNKVYPVPARTYQFSPPLTIGSFRNVATMAAAAGGVSLSVGSLRAITAIGANIGLVYRQVNAAGGSINALCFSNIATLGIALNANNAATMSSFDSPRFSKLQSLGGTLHILEYSRDAANFYVTDQTLGTLTKCGSANTIVGTHLAPLETDGVTMYAQLPEGIYDFDITPSIVVGSERAKDKNCMQVMFENYLYFKNKKSWIKYDGTDTESVGYDLRDGLASEKFGEITAVCASWKWQFVAVKGGTYSHILTLDNRNKWQYYTRIPTAGLWIRDVFLSDAPDAIDRLWVLFDNYAYPGYFLNPMVNPLQAGTYSYVPTGEFTPPRYDAGLAEVPAGWYEAHIIGDAVSSGNSITCYYGLNGDSPVTTLGKVATLTDTLKYASPVGVEAYRLQPKFMLSRESSGTTPVFRKAIIHYIKDPDKREEFEFDLDIRQSSRDTVRSEQSIIGSLNYLANLRTLFPFHYGQIGTKYVRMVNNPFAESVNKQDVYEQEREGRVRIRLTEMG